MTQLDLDQIDTVIAAATPGPWCTDGAEIYQGDEYLPGLSAWIGETCRADESDGGKADAAYIAAMNPETAKAMADEIRRLRARTLTEPEHNRAWHAIEGAAGEEGADPGTVLNAVLRALGINPPAEETHVAADDSSDPEHIDDCPGCDSTRPCGHDAHEWADRPGVWCPGITYADDQPAARP